MTEDIDERKGETGSIVHGHKRLGRSHAETWSSKVEASNWKVSPIREARGSGLVLWGTARMKGKERVLNTP